MYSAIKVFDFDVLGLQGATWSAGISVLNGKATLKKTGGAYPLDDGIFIQTPISNPKGAKRWTGFISDHSHIKDCSGAYLTSIQFRLNNGLDDLHWNGSAWVVGTATDWNTEAEIAENIASFPNATQSISVIANLKTTSSKYTPTLRSIRLLFETNLEDFEDYARSILQRLKSIRPTATQRIRAATSSSQVDMGTFPISTQYDITAYDAVYNTTSDPYQLNNILLTSNLNNKILTLSVPVAAQDVLDVHFQYKPVVAENTDQDYKEYAKLPAISLENMSIVSKTSQNIKEYVFDKNRPTIPGKVIFGRQNHIEFDVVWATTNSIDHFKLANVLRRNIYRDPFLHKIGTDDKYSLHIMEEYSEQSESSDRDGRTGRLRLRVLDALFYDREADAHPVSAINLTLARA